ncbi:putative transmembrane anti-sigma factor [Thioalkalivibrio nitratireducens DSM 14787]|uniref:Transmembrane anti-sigma factor n=1 Tax=Thioalkalivibrio nitratireducens (strain DSM 14787 / UNIQEM 213 / ALEN2) TaxID=1255043 RepID=L0DUQ3_THIND|nr:anti-sigma factor [Thioalkalivibrio nitratireducens]AGA32081.1 putative transmembrane anti-sigma factor [Thioalkalivibrio nitratireducens DSM 14787]
MSDRRPSEEILNAFVDGEFSPEDRLGTLKTIAADEALSRDVCDLYQLKELVAMAYRADTLPAPDVRQCRTGERHPAAWLTAVAASLVALALGTIAVLEMTREQVLDGPQQVATAPDGTAATVPDAGERADQVLLHVTDVQIDDAEVLFDDIEFMFETAWLHGQDLEVQVVVHGNAMDLVRADLAPFPNRIRELVHTYPGLRITACGQSRARHERQEGRMIEFLPWVEEVESGVREAAQKQQQGWTYIRV